MAHVNSAEAVAREWAAYWQKRPIPILEATRTELQQLARRAERVHTSRVAEVVLKDPLLTLQALRLIGQRSRSAMSADVVSIESIVMLMGVTPFLERFSTLPTVESLLKDKYPQDYATFQQELYLARFTARLAQQFANWRYDARPEEVVTAALLSRTGALLALVGARMDAKLPPLAGALGGFLKHIGLPEALIDLESAEVEAPQRVAMQRSLQALVAAFNRGWWQPEIAQELDLIAGILGMEADEVWRALCRLALMLANDPALPAEFLHPARWLPMLPGEWPQQDVQPATLAEKPGGRVDPLQEHMQALHLAGQRGLAAKDIMSLTLKALSEGLGLQRIVLSLLVAGKAEVRARYVLGVPETHPLRALTIPLPAGSLFARLLEKPQSLWFNPATAGQFAPHLPTGFVAHYPCRHFCAMSIFVGSKPLGMIVADGLDQPLTEHHYQHFKQICLLTTRALTHSVSR